MIDVYRLKPCPFCGGKAVTGGSLWHVIIRCENSGANHDAKVIANTEEEAIHGWNSRVNQA